MKEVDNFIPAVFSSALLVGVAALIAVALIFYVVSRTIKKKNDRTRRDTPAPPIDSFVILPAGDRTNGLGTIFGKLFRQVFEQSPERVAILERMNVSIGIQDTIVQSTALTMSFRDTAVTIENGVQGTPDIYIEGDIETLVKLPGMAKSLKNVIFTSDGREIIMKVFKKELKAKGVFANRKGFRDFRRLVR